jgi:quercetin dioxygenase-like cupin family protein
MTEAGLTALVEAYAADPSSWEGETRHDTDERTFVLLHRDPDTEVWLVCWSAGHDTGFHDHDGSAAAIRVARGTIREERLGLGGASGQEYTAGDALTVDPNAIHRVIHAGDAPAVTIHAYSPPLSRMGAYETTASGELQRHSISYDQELRPLGGVLV